MPSLRVSFAAALTALCVSATAQTTAPGVPAPVSTGRAPLSDSVRPALAQVAQTLNTVNTRRWKAPQPVRDEADGDINSIQRDLNGTLAGLLQQADAAPGSVPAAFAVYRNLDALYDTLLRVVETAELAAPENEAGQLESSLRSLEGARSNLGDTVFTGAQAQQTELVRLRTAIAAGAAEARSPVKTVVVNDGPATHTTATHHRRTTSATKKPSSGSASSSSSGSQSQSSKPNAGTAIPQ
ncbi:MAG TPA: hypothetical protein VME68_10220 [Acidobacteriaceae bacterium]|nr:hypothetical protein [Acidobacteriaceae bacterium]